MLKLRTWLEAERGRTTALANHLSVSLSRISQMADDGVPPKYMLAVRDFTRGAVTLESLVQDRTDSTAPVHVEAQDATDAELVDSTPKQPPDPAHQARVAINFDTEQGAAHA